MNGADETNRPEVINGLADDVLAASLEPFKAAVEDGDWGTARRLLERMRNGVTVLDGLVPDSEGESA